MQIRKKSAHFNTKIFFLFFGKRSFGALGAESPHGGAIWLYMAVYEYMLLRVAVYGAIWLYMAAFCCKWVHGCMWLYMVCTWLHMVINGCIWRVNVCKSVYMAVKEPRRSGSIQLKHNPVARNAGCDETAIDVGAAELESACAQPRKRYERE